MCILMVTTNKAFIEYKQKEIRKQSKCGLIKNNLRHMKAVMEKMRDKKSTRNTENKT